MKLIRHLLRRATLLVVASLVLGSAAVHAQTNPAAQSLPFTLSAQPTSTLPAGVAVHKFASIPTTRTTSPADADCAYNSTSNAGGWLNAGVNGADGIGILPSGSNAAAAVVVAINTTGKTGINISWVCRTILQQTSRDDSCGLQYRIGTSGNFTDVNSNNSTYTSQGKAANDASPTFTEILPVAAENQPVVQLRWIFWESNGSSGSRDRIAVDDISVTAATVGGTNPAGVASAASSAVAPGDSVLLTVTVTPGTGPASTGLSVTGDLSAIGGSATQAFSSGPNNTFTYTATVPANAAFGPRHLTFAVQDAQARTAAAALDLNVAGNLTIFHTNDTHARVTPHKWIVPKHSTETAPDFEDVGGIAYMGAKVLSLATGTPDALVLDGGDISEGNPIGDWNGPGFNTGTYGDGTIVDYFKMLDTKLKAIPGRGGRGLDAMVVGNHDIRDISYINNMKAASAQFPILSINVCKKGTHTPYFQASTIINLNGNKIGIVGYTTESADSPEPDVNNLIDVVKCDWDGTASDTIHFSSIVNDLRNNQGCTMVILLTHMGHSGLCTPTGANPNPILVDNASGRVPEVVVSGHWHTYCDTVWQPTSLNYKTIFTEAGSFQHYVGELKVTSAGKYLGSTYYPLRNSEITPDPDIAAYLQTRMDQYAATNPQYGVNQVLGYTADNLLLDNYMKWWSADEYPWSGNNTAGNWICDAVQWRAQQLFGSCDLSVEAGGGVRSDIVAGPVQYTHIYETFPWPDDTIYVVHMTGQQIWDFFKDHNCDAALSSNWHVTAFDGNPTAITFNGQPVNLTQTYTVAINNYMYLHDTSNFATIDANPLTSTELARTALFDYTKQFGQGNPYNAGPPRYTLNTDFSGGYRAVVMMMNDDDDKESFKDGFIRLLSALPETLAHRGTQQVPTELVNADGSVNQANRLAENEWYRSYLGFRKNVLHPGDIVEVWGKGSFFGGNPEFVDQEGIQSDGVEFKIVGHDESLAKPTYFSSIAGFWNETYKNHYVKFLARKVNATTVTDKSGAVISLMDKTAYSAVSALPGNTGDLLVITGVPTAESFALRFRCDSAVLASTQGFTDYPPESHVDAVAPTEQTTPTLPLTATANVAPGNIFGLLPTDDATVSSGNPTTPNNGTTMFVASGAMTFGNERGWLRFDLSSIPAGATITSAQLSVFCWGASTTAMPTIAAPANSDNWTADALTWNTQPTFGAALGTVTLAANVEDVTYFWEVGSFVQSKLGSSTKAASFVLKAVTEDSPSAPTYKFDTTEFKSNIPTLKVTIDPAGVQSAAITQVQFAYRYSTDGLNWNGWSNFQTATTAPYTASFSYPNGYGYYEFYSTATDSNNNVEPAAPYGDTAVHFTPGAITGAPTNITGNGATVGGSYNPYGTDASVSFEYGLDTNYGNATASQSLGHGNSIVNFSSPLANLQAGMVYHVRAVIVSNGVTTYGADQTFTTASQDVPTMPSWAWITLGGALVIVAGSQLARQRKASPQAQA